MNNRTETTTGIPPRGASFYSGKRVSRLLFALLLTGLMLWMDWPKAPEGRPDSGPGYGETLPAVTRVRAKGLRMGDSITLVAAPVAEAEFLREQCRERNVRLVFLLSEEQEKHDPLLSRKLRSDGHSVMVASEESGRIRLPYDLNAGDIEIEEVLETLFDGCVLLCPARNNTQTERLLRIADIVRTQGVRIVIPEGERG